MFLKQTNECFMKLRPWPPRINILGRSSCTSLCMPDPSWPCLHRISIEARKSPKLPRAAQEISRSPRLPMRKPSIGSPSLARREFPFEDITQVVAHVWQCSISAVELSATGCATFLPTLPVPLTAKPRCRQPGSAAHAFCGRNLPPEDLWLRRIHTLHVPHSSLFCSCSDSSLTCLPPPHRIHPHTHAP
jgi:hypothetical protein